MKTLFAFTLFTATASAAVPLEWTARPGEIAPAQFTRHHGETLELRCRFAGFGESPFSQGADIRLWYQTNGMPASAWWSVPAQVSSNELFAVFAPESDPGADQVKVFFGAPSNAYASAVLRLRPSPGAAPGTLPPPEGFAEADPVFAAWLATDPFSGLAPADYETVSNRAMSAVQPAEMEAAISAIPRPDLTPATNYTNEAIGRIPAPDFSTGNSNLVETIKATAPAPGNYETVSNRAMSAVQPADMAAAIAAIPSPDLTPATNYTNKAVSDFARTNSVVSGGPYQPVLPYETNAIPYSAIADAPEMEADRITDGTNTIDAAGNVYELEDELVGDLYYSGSFDFDDKEYWPVENGRLFTSNGTYYIKLDDYGPWVDYEFLPLSGYESWYFVDRSYGTFFLNTRHIKTARLKGKLVLTNDLIAATNDLAQAMGGIPAEIAATNTVPYSRGIVNLTVETGGTLACSTNDWPNGGQVMVKASLPATYTAANGISPVGYYEMPSQGNYLLVLTRMDNAFYVSVITSLED